MRKPIASNRNPDRRGIRSGAHPVPPRRSPGFTLLELVVVLSILTVLTAVVVPVFGDALSAMKRRGARGDLIALVYYAQELAIRESRELRLYLDTREHTYWLEGWVDGHGDEKSFAPITGRDSGTHHLPPQLKFAHVHARTDRTRRLNYVAFMPTGACDRARIHLSPVREGEPATTIETTGVLGGLDISP